MFRSIAVGILPKILLLTMMASCNAKHRQRPISVGQASENKPENDSLNIYSGSVGRPAGSGYLARSGYYSLNSTACSATEIVKDRCIITANHCLTMAGAPLVYGQTSTVATNVKEMPVLRQLPYAGTRTDAALDIALLWVADKYINASGAPRILGNATFEPRTPALPPVVGSVVTVTGYGPTMASGAAGISNIGQMKVTSIEDVSDSTAQLKGQVMTLAPQASYRQGICAGDSGGAELFNGSLVGVTSRSTEVACNDAGILYAASFGNGTLNWLNTNIDSFCRSKVTTDVSIDGFTTEAVIGKDVVTQNTVILCTGGYSDTQNICSVSASINDISLKAYTISNTQEFDMWNSVSIGSCPCDSSTNPTCVISHNFLNYSAMQDSMENAKCKAKFKLKNTMPTTIPSTGTTTTPTPLPAPTVTPFPTTSTMPAMP